MNFIEAIILGLTQGLTEFLPVSSSGHLALASLLLDVECSLMLSVWLHFGTLCAVVFYYRKTLWNLLKNPRDKKLLYLVTASIPTFAIALTYKLFVSERLQAVLLPLGFAVSAALMTTIDFLPSGNKTCRKLGLLPSLAVGAAQGVACINGLTRSGTTIFALRCFELKPEEAGEFSFLLSIPVILAGAAVETLSAFSNKVEIAFAPTLAAVAVAAVSGFFAIKLFIRLLSAKKFIWFGIYLLFPLLLSLLIIQ